MKKIVLLGALCLNLLSAPARADLFGGDLPLLAEIVVNTLQTLREVEAQTSLAKAELEGIKEKVTRMTSIADLVQPSSWEEWKDPAEAVKRLQKIYYTLPKEFRSGKSDEIEAELAAAMNELGKLSAGAKETFRSGKELETKGIDASPGVAQKLTASGIGTLVAMSAQEQVLISHATSLLVQGLAQKQEDEARSIVTAASTLKSISEGLSQDKASFSKGATSTRRERR